jgi:hypothetical protein
MYMGPGKLNSTVIKLQSVGTGVQFPAETEIFPSTQFQDQLCPLPPTHTPFYPLSSGDSLSGGKAAGKRC